MGANMGPTFDPVVTNNCVRTLGTIFGIPGANIFSESIPNGFVTTCCRFMTDCGSLFSNFVRFIEVFAVVLGTLLKQILAYVFLKFTADGQGSD